MNFLVEFVQFLAARKKFWLIPLVIILLFLSLMVVLAGSSALSPFIYTLF